MTISEVVESLQDIQDEMGDVEVVILSGRWEDCRSSDNAWPIVNEVLSIGFQNIAAVCTKYNEPTDER